MHLKLTHASIKNELKLTRTNLLNFFQISSTRLKTGKMLFVFKQACFWGFFLKCVQNLMVWQFGHLLACFICKKNVTFLLFLAHSVKLTIIHEIGSFHSFGLFPFCGFGLFENIYGQIWPFEFFDLAILFHTILSE